MSNSQKFDVASLLRDPGAFVVATKETGGFGRLAGFLVLLTLVGTALFGAALGSFVDGRVALLDAAKLSGIVVFSFAICYPTMYVFACISGSTLSALRLFGFGLVSTATLGCLLAALAPILWLFAVSTEAVGFIVMFACGLDSSVSVEDVELSVPGESVTAAMDAEWAVSRHRAAVEHVLTKTLVSDLNKGLYRAFVLEERPIDEVAARFGIPNNSVSQIKTRVEKMIAAVEAEYRD